MISEVFSNPVTLCFHGTAQCRIWPWCSHSLALPAHASLHAACYAVHKHIGHKSNSTHSPAKHHRGTRDESYSCCGNHNFKISDSSTLKERVRKKSHFHIILLFFFFFFFQTTLNFVLQFHSGTETKRRSGAANQLRHTGDVPVLAAGMLSPALPQWHRTPACPTPG